MKKFEKCDVTCSWTPSPVTKCHTFLDPLERDVLYGRPLCYIVLCYAMLCYVM